MNWRFFATLGVLGCWCAPSQALVIDDFLSGPVTGTPSSTSPGLVGINLGGPNRQTGLPSTSVIGGEREAFFLLGGAVSIGGGELVLDHDQASYQAGFLGYSRFATDPGLDADFTVGGNDELLIRVSASDYPEVPASPNQMTIALTSNRGTFDVSAAAVTVDFIDSSGPYVISVPYSDFGPNLDLTDIDGISISFDLTRSQMSLSVERIEARVFLPGDYNADGMVDADDLARWREQFGAMGSLAADGNGDGVVNAADYTLLRDILSGFGPAFAVPEPASAVLVLLAMGVARPARATTAR